MNWIIWLLAVGTTIILWLIFRAMRKEIKELKDMFAEQKEIDDKQD
jgi:hypothetical protein